MKRSNWIQIWAVIAAAGLVVVSTGCTERFLFGTGATFVSGLLLGNNLTGMTVDQTCYQNGVLVDCDNLPEELGE